jgi:type IV/VI secretion system ImpK/VasF family protein
MPVCVCLTVHNLDAFTRDCFHAIVRNRQASATTPAESETRHLETRDHIDRMIGRALAAGIPRYDVYAATFAIVSLADAVGTRDRGALGLHWRRHMLEPHYFADSQTQPNFYERIEEARRTHRHDVLRVYATCLALGYRGRFHAAEAEAILAKLQREVQPGTWSLGEAPVMPQPRLRRPMQLYWVPFAAFIVCLACYTIFSSSIRHRAAMLTGAADSLVQGN